MADADIQEKHVKLLMLTILYIQLFGVAESIQYSIVTFVQIKAIRVNRNHDCVYIYIYVSLLAIYSITVYTNNYINYTQKI